MRSAVRVGVVAVVLVTFWGCGSSLKDVIQISTTSLPNAAVNLAYSATLQATGGTAPYTWAVESGPLPAGLSLSSDGTISGTPTAAGTTTFTVRVDDSDRKTLHKTGSISLTVNPEVVISTTTLPDGVATRSYNLALAASGGTGTLTWSLASGPLPAGMTLNSAGQLTGTPSATGTFTVTVSVSDVGPPVQTKTKTLDLIVQSALAVANTGLSNGVVSIPYLQTLTARGGISPYTWSVVNSALDPPGVDFTVAGPSTGTYSGTPTASGRFTFTIRLTDTSNAAVPAGSADTTFTVLILNAPAAYVANSGSGTVSVLNISTNTLIQTIPVGTTPTGVAVSADAATVYVTNNGSNNVSVIDTLTNTVTTTVPVGNGPVGVVALPDGRSVYVANQTSNNVMVIDTASNTVIATLPIPFLNAQPTGLAASGDSRLIFLTLKGTDQVVVILNDPTSPAFHTIIAVLGVGTDEDPPVAAEPTGIAFAPVTSTVYVALPGEDAVAFIDVDLAALTFTVSGTIELVDATVMAPPTRPIGVGVGPNCNFVHITKSGAAEVAVADTINHELIFPAFVGTSPQEIAFTTDGAFAYVTNSGSNNVSVIDISNNAEVDLDNSTPQIDRITVGTAPMGIAIPPDPALRFIAPPPPPAPPTRAGQFPTGGVSLPYGTRACAAGGLPPYKFTADTAEVPPGLAMDEKGVISGEPSTPSIAANPTDPRFAPSHNPNQFTFTTTLEDSATQTLTGDFLLQVCCFGFPTLAYVANFDANSVSFFDLVTETTTAISTGIGQNPLGVAAAPSRLRVYVTNFNSNTVSVIDVHPDSSSFNSVIAAVTVGDGPAGIVVTPDSSRVYVTNEDAGTVSVIDAATNTLLVSGIPVGNSPEGIAITPDGSRVYVANIFSNTVSVIDTASNTVVATVSVGLGPVGVAVAVTSGGTFVYVTNQFSDSVSVIDTATNTVVATVVVGNFPTGIAIANDFFTGFAVRAYVANQLSNDVSVIDISTNTEFPDFDPSTPERDRIAVGTSPDFVAIFSETSGFLAYVTNFGSGDVTKIDINPFSPDFHKALGTISVDRRPEGIAIRIPP